MAPINAGIFGGLASIGAVTWYKGFELPPAAQRPSRNWEREPPYLTPARQAQLLALGKAHFMESQGIPQSAKSDRNDQSQNPTGPPGAGSSPDEPLIK